ncbi:MAG: bifunctional diaminohydroxyphosphoribosylaminopyrimidine deaminase/5-amino-6-(5-phosphoribosylamino)uracil reductase RibD [Candidatus Aminicenantes bacterium]|nr:bifunctional diaminohydroxyphosphoribosylaminopyrimidine deaminase/5-amino-6-(5-phosphoribosylamino)uracil reductase RibD [Candidatus Aminicenantes bacterium]
MTEYKDISYLHMCYGLAEKAVGWASPNPYVGAVIEKKGIIVGHGYHEMPGKPHAEAVALEKAGAQSKGATAYINLEPCVHWGRTPPCIDKILQADLKRVVISSVDPNPLVNGKGIQRMKNAGIEVSLGLLKQRNDRLNEIYLKYIQNNIPFVTLKTALSLDGKTATKTHSSKWISSPETRKYMHLLRGEQEAIMVGINTILQDDPRLTVRHPSWPGKKITRVIVDSKLRMPSTAKILSTLSKGGVIVFTLEQSISKNRKVLQKKGVKIVSLPGKGQRVDIKKVLEWLGNHKISSVLVEGGNLLQTHMLENKLIDKIMISISPKLVGGQGAHCFFQGAGVQTISQSLKIKEMNEFQIGNDIVVQGYI